MFEASTPAIPETTWRRIENWLTPQRFLVGVVLATTLVVYLGTLQYDFVYDDHEQIVENPYLRSWHYLPTFLTESLWQQFSPLPGSYYRPLFQAWLGLEYTLFGLRAWGWHLTSVLLHVAVTFLVYRLARRLLQDDGAALFAAAIFGLHPVHTEAVAWVSALPEPLIAVFLIAAFLAYLNSRVATPNRRAWLGVSLLWFVLGLVTKETALVFPLLVLAFHLIFDEESKLSALRRGLVATLPYLALTAVYIEVRVKVIGEVAKTMTLVPWRIVLLTWPSLLWFDVGHLVWPLGLGEFYDRTYVLRPDASNFVLPLAGVVVVALALAWLAKQSRQAAFACAWLLIPLLPLLDLAALPKGDFAHDRYLYLPSVGFSMLAALALRRFAVGRREAWGAPAGQWLVAAGLAVTLGFSTAYQSRIWKNDLALASYGVAIAAANPLAWNTLGRAWAARRFFYEAEKDFAKSLALEPMATGPNYNLAYLCFQEGRLSEAEVYLNHAIALNPTDSRQFVLMGRTELALARLGEAERMFRRALELSPDAAGYHFMLGTVLRLEGKLPAALEEFKAELARHPEDVMAARQVAESEAALKRRPPSP